MTNKFIQRMLDKTLNVPRDDNIKSAILPDMIPPFSVPQAQESHEPITAKSEPVNIREGPIMENKFTPKINPEKTTSDSSSFIPKDSLSPRDSAKHRSEDKIHVDEVVPAKPHTLVPKDNLATRDSAKQETDDKLKIDKVISVKQHISATKTNPAKTISDSSSFIPKDNLPFPHSEKSTNDNYLDSITNQPTKKDQGVSTRVEGKLITSNKIQSPPSVLPYSLKKNTPNQSSEISPRIEPDGPKPNEKFVEDLQSINQIHVSKRNVKPNASVQQDTVVTISIGRVEVHAASPPIDKKIKHANIMNLADYLKLRTGRQP